MRLAIIVGGWHFPMYFYRAVAQMPLPPGWTRDLFVVTHRDPDLDIVRAEKLEELAFLPDEECGRMDRELYARYASCGALDHAGWRIQHEPNTVGDWGFFNQWLETHDYKKYDLLLNCHDDTFLVDPNLLVDVIGQCARLFDATGERVRCSQDHWLVLGNGICPNAQPAYVRGSFEFWRPRMLELLGGKIDLGNIALTREGLTDSPIAMETLMPWNAMDIPFRKFMISHGLTDKVRYLSPHYRVSKYVIEGERGFISRRGGAPWSFEAGLKELVGLASRSCSTRC